MLSPDSVNVFDYSIIHFVNGFAQHSRGFDTFVATIEQSNLLKGGISLALFWWAWFGVGKPGVGKPDTGNPDARDACDAGQGVP